jgi:Bacterial capsule synthesis protein PGA_cap
MARASRPVSGVSHSSTHRTKVQTEGASLATLRVAVTAEGDPFVVWQRSRGVGCAGRAEQRDYRTAGSIRVGEWTTHRQGIFVRNTRTGWCVLLVLLAGCTGVSGESQHHSEGGDTSSSTKSSGPELPPTSGVSGGGSPSSAVPTGHATPVTIAFAGDVHFEGTLASRLSSPATAMGPLAGALRRADVAIVNLETAVTTRGTPEVKEFRFRAPPVVFDALTDAGIDVVTMANNHALDYGPVSLPDALTAAKNKGMPVIGIGRNAAAAFRPWIVTVHGERIAFLAATAVVDPSLVATWAARGNHGGVATAIDGHNAALVAAIKDVRPSVDTVVVDMHYGSDLTQCPTEIQRGVVRDAVRAGADVVVGQHAHALLGAGYSGSAFVSYGLGNFQFYYASGVSAETGVLTLTVDGRNVSHPHWSPGTIVGGLPVPLTGAAAATALSRWRSLRGCTGLTARPR